MTRKILESATKCPICETRMGTLSNGCCSACDKPLKEEWLGKKTFKSSTNNHTSRLKLIVNPILRKLQFWTKTPYVIVSIVENIHKEKDVTTYVFYKYSFRPMRYFKTIQEKNIWYANLLLETPEKDKNI